MLIEIRLNCFHLLHLDFVLPWIALIKRLSTSYLPINCGIRLLILVLVIGFRLDFKIRSFNFTNILDLRTWTFFGLDETESGWLCLKFNCFFFWLGIVQLGMWFVLGVVVKVDNLGMEMPTRGICPLSLTYLMIVNILCDLWSGV